MRTVHLYGSMAEQFGSSFTLQVRSLAEAAMALGTQLPGFKKAVEEGRFRVTCGPSRTKGLHLDKDTITLGLPENEDIHIVPVLQGAGRGGLGKIIVGTLIAAATWWAGGPAWLVSIGASMALAGVSQMLAPKKKAEKTKQSFMIEAPEARLEGGCVPVIIGRVVVRPPEPISSGVTVSDSNGLL